VPLCKHPIRKNASRPNSTSLPEPQGAQGNNFTATKEDKEHSQLKKMTEVTEMNERNSAAGQHYIKIRIKTMRDCVTRVAAAAIS
jgi:hypothetical protein